MAATKIADLAIVPVTFQEYLEKLIMQKSALFRSGIIVPVPTGIPSKGKTTNAPAYLGFDGADEVLSDSAALTVNSIGSVNSVAVINFRGKAFGSNDLVDELSGKDPLGDLATKYADYWVRRLNIVALSSMQGASAGLDAAFGAGTIINDQSGVSFSTGLVLDTRQLMGEYGSEFNTIVMHSAIHTAAVKADLTADVVIDSIGTKVETFLGMRVVVDDTISPTAGVYDTYLTKTGAMGYSEGMDSNKSIEVDRDILAGDDITTSRKRYILHPNGSSWIGTPAGNSPTNTELATAGNWGAEDANEDKRFPVRVLKSLV